MSVEIPAFPDTMNAGNRKWEQVPICFVGTNQFLVMSIPGLIEFKDSRCFLSS